MPTQHQDFEPRKNGTSEVQFLVNEFDVLIIGGGVNGTGVARDCALRGLKVGLFEKHDFGFGASGNNSGMIHGGPRYLTSHPEVTKISCVDSGHIQRIASHMIFRIPFIFPIENRGWTSRFELAAVDAFFSFYDEFQPLKQGRPHALLKANDLPKVFPGLEGNFVGAVTFDEWGIDGARLCVLNAIDASMQGAEIQNHTEVIELCRVDNHWMIKVREMFSKAVRTYIARAVVNATGSWTDRFLSLAFEKTETQPPLVRPGKGIHVLYDRRFSNYGVLTRAIDGREIFLMPWQNISWIATTDDDFFGSPDEVEPQDDEVAYLVNGITHIFPAVQEGKIVGINTGVRPTMYEYGKLEDKLSREHAIVHHDKWGHPSLFSMIGGKLASYRIFAEEMSDLLARSVFSDRGLKPCSTHLRPLPGSEDSNITVTRSLLPSHLDPITAERHLARYGNRASELAIRRAQLVCRCESVTDTEIEYVCKSEYAKTLDDVSRRTGLGRGLCQGTHCLTQAATCIAKCTGRDEATIQVEIETFKKRSQKWANMDSGMPANHRSA